jgi:lipoyl-dependent peroxiredoxin
MADPESTKEGMNAMATRNGSARWNGDLSSGNGRVTVGDSAWTGPYSFTSRFGEGTGTNPEELIAAAHAGCFSMAFAHALNEAGHAPAFIETAARVQLRAVDGTPTIVQIELETLGDVEGLDEARFREFAESAKASCTISRALAGVERISVSATLVSQAGASVRRAA